MLTSAKMGVGQERYYLDSIAEATTEYYRERGEALGVWMGRGSQDLHLVGTVNGDELALLLEHRDPATGEQLGRHHAPIPGWDHTFAAPKSVSVIWGLTIDKEIGRAFERAQDGSVAAGLEHLEEQLAYGRRGKGGVFSIETTGLVAASFRHRTARSAAIGTAGDPHLHNHVVVVNQVHGVDGQWSATDSKRAYTEKTLKTAGMLYQADLRWRLNVELAKMGRGVRWGEVTEHGQAELAGVSEEMRDRFSKRTDEITRELSEITRELNAERRALGLPELKLHSRDAYEVARRQTRAAKIAGLTDAELGRGWRAELQAAGVDAERLVAAVLVDHPVEVKAHLAPRERRVMQRQLAERLTYECSTYDREDVIRAVCCYMQGGLPAAEILAEADRYIESGWAVPVAATEREVITRKDGRTVLVRDDVPLYTTAEMLETEREVVSLAISRQGRGVARVAAWKVEHAIEQSSVSLSQEQAKMVRTLCTSGNGVDVVLAGPGTGKTTAMRAAVEAWRSSGHEVVGAALSSQARDELHRGAGCEARTLASWLSRLEGEHGRPPQHLAEDSVMILDEAGMPGTRDIRRVLRLAKRDRFKLVLSGDTAQLPEIEAGGAYAGLASRLGAIQLTENHRQVDEWNRQAVADARAGEWDKVVDAYERRDRITFCGDDFDRAADGMVERYFRARDSGETPLMLALACVRRDELNRRARAERVRRGEVAEDGVQTSRYVIGVGDEVVTTKPDEWRRHGEASGVINGTTGRVVGVDRHGRITIETDHDLPSKPGQRVTTLDAKYVRDHVELSYARNDHKAQGATVDVPIILSDANTASAEETLVAISRGKQPAYISWLGPRPAQELHGPQRQDERAEAEQMAAAWQRSRRKTMALDQLQEPETSTATPPPDPRPWEPDPTTAAYSRNQGREGAVERTW